MKTNAIFSFLLIIFGLQTNVGSQINYSFNFNANATGWTGNFSRFTGTTACGGAGGAMRRNLYSTQTTGQLISPSVGTSNGLQATVSYTYKAAVWSANTAAASNWGSFIVQYGPTATGPWTNIETVTNETQLGNACISKSHSVVLPAGNTFIRFSATWQSGDYYLNFDNLTVAQSSNTPPACIASPSAPTNGQTNVGLGQQLSWPTSTGATGYDVFFGTSATPSQVATNQAGTTYNPGALNPSTTYYWRVVPRNTVGPATGCATWSFTTGIPNCANTASWLSVTAPTNNTALTISTFTYQTNYNTINSVVAGSQYQSAYSLGGYITVRSGTFNAPIIAQGNSPLNWTATVPGAHFVHYNTNSACGTASNFGTSTIQCLSCTAPTPPANDLVCSATSISCGATLSGTTINATNSGTGEGVSCGTAQNQPGVWYVVAGNGQTMTASLCATAWDSKISVYSGANCSTLTCVGGNDDAGPACTGTSASYSWSSVVGTNYYILVHGYSSTSAFSINLSCVTPPPPPSNDACANATSLPCSTSGLAGTTVNSVAETAPSACVGTNGVWYSFVGDGQVSTITVFSALDLGLYIGSGSCAGLTPIRCEDYFIGGTNETTSIITTSGVTYYVYVANYTGSTTGTFTISRTCNAPLSNDNCANAQSVSIQCPATATSVSGTTLNASEEPSLADPTCDDGLIRDVWYTFNSGPNTSVNLTATLGTATWLGGQIFTTCGTPATGLTIGGNAGNCDFDLSDPSPTVISGLTTNTTYRLRLFTNVSYDNPGTFSFTLTNSVNNPGAVSVPASICAGTATSITNVTAATGAPGTVNYYFYYRGGPSNVGWQLYDGPTTNTSSSLPAAVINTPGTWFIARNSDFGCGQANNATTADLQLIVNSLPTVTANASSTAPCVGQNVTLTGGGATSYLWNNGVSNGVSFTPASTTTYTVTGTTGSCSGTAQVTVTLPTQGAALGNNSENATCTVNQAGWIHFYHSSGRLLASINSGGQNLGNVTVTSYVDGANAIVPACDMPSVETALMQRHWVITPQFQPTSNVLVRLPFGSAEVSSLATAAGTTSNTADNSTGIPNIQLSRYHGPANVNASALDNCSENGGDENTVIHSPSANGTTNAYSNVNGEHYNEYSIPQFSEFWLHWQADNSPLPVNLTQTHLECAENKVIIDWTTASEQNADKFVIQRSRDINSWETVGEVTAAGNSSSSLSYTFVDQNPFGGDSYYRLVQYDFDGTATVYGSWNVACEVKNTLNIYPNPTQGKFTVSIYSEEDLEDAYIDLLDVSGKIISSEKIQIQAGTSEVYKDLSELNAGTYLVVIRTENNVFSPVRIVKGH